MTVVDASVLVSAVSGDLAGSLARERLMTAIEEAEALDAPALAAYEVANALVRLTYDGRIERTVAVASWQSIRALPITYHELKVDAERSMEIAGALRRRSIYDAAYLALAERLGTTLLTMDGPLARNCESLGFRVVLLA